MPHTAGWEWNVALLSTMKCAQSFRSSRMGLNMIILIIIHSVALSMCVSAWKILYIAILRMHVVMKHRPRFKYA